MTKPNVHQTNEAQSRQDIETKSFLKYLNSEAVRVGKVHQIYSSVRIYTHDVRWAEMKARFLTGTYTVRLGSRKTGLSPPVIFTDRSKAVLLLWFIFICYHIYNVCLLHDFVATLGLSALLSALYFILSKLAL